MEGGLWRRNEGGGADIGSKSYLQGLKTGGARGCGVKHGHCWERAGGLRWHLDGAVVHIFATCRRIDSENSIPERSKIASSTPSTTWGGKTGGHPPGTNTSMTPKGDSWTWGLLARWQGYTGLAAAGPLGGGQAGSRTTLERKLIGCASFVGAGFGHVGSLWRTLLVSPLEVTGRNMMRCWF